MDQDHLPGRDLILDSLTEGVFTVDKELNIVLFNQAAEQITGIPRREAVGLKCYEVLRASVCQANCALEESMRTGRPVLDRAVNILDSSGRLVPISIRTSALRDEAGRILGGVETFRDLSTEVSLRKELRGKYTLGDMVGRAEVMLSLFAVLPDVAESASTVLIQGESGTGKELLARAIHNMSPRSKGPFLAVNCAALPDTLLESELFGYVRGAFTDAKADKPGRFEAARGGTLFLDEIGEISPAVQVKLLRVLDERAFVPLGSNKPRPADVRLVAATNKQLVEEVRCGRFRDDLFYRLNIIRLELPPLRERREDIPHLIEALINKLQARTGREISGLSERALAALMAHPFPGNVRQLENFLEHGFVLCHSGIIDLDHLPKEVRELGPLPGQRSGADGLLVEAERRLITDTLNRHSGRRKIAAQELGISTTTLWRRMKQYGLL